jgi:hypothetical protein
MHDRVTDLQIHSPAQPAKQPTRDPPATGALAEAVSMRAGDPIAALHAPGPVLPDLARSALAALGALDPVARRQALHELRACGAVERLLAALPAGAASGPHGPIVEELIALVRRPGPPEPKAKPEPDHEPGPGPHERHREERPRRPRRR